MKWGFPTSVPQPASAHCQRLTPYPNRTSKGPLHETDASNSNGRKVPHMCANPEHFIYIRSGNSGGLKARGLESSHEHFRPC